MRTTNSSRNKTQYVILGLLSEEPLTGYEMKRIIDMRLSFFWNESFGQLYPTLGRLAAEGLITVQREDGKHGSVRYAITPSGRAALKAWLKEPAEKELIRYELLLKLYFSTPDTAEEMLAQVQAFEESHRGQLELFRQFERELTRDIDTHENHRQILMVLAFGQRVWSAYAQWCEETARQLKEAAEREKEEGK